MELIQPMTEAQRDAYLRSLKGKKDLWRGWVYGVQECYRFSSRKYEGYEAFVDLGQYRGVVEHADPWEVKFKVSESTALELNKDQFITFTGMIDSVGYTLRNKKIVRFVRVKLRDVKVEGIEPTKARRPEAPSVRPEAREAQKYSSKGGRVIGVGVYKVRHPNHPVKRGPIDFIFGRDRKPAVRDYYEC